MAKTIKSTTIVIKCEHLTAQRVRLTARKDITFTSQDGTVTVTVKAGEVFYLAKSDSLGEGMYYLVVADLASSTLWRCYCPSYKPCKHEKDVQADNNKRYSTLAPSQRALMAHNWRGPRQQPTTNTAFGAYSFKGKRADLAREHAALNGNRGFSLMR